MNVATGQIAPAPVHGDGPGKTGQIVIWRDGAARQFEYRWGLRPSEPGGRPWSLLRAEGRAIDNPCLIIANDFQVQTEAHAGKKRHRVSLLTDKPFFCIAGIWRPATRDWPDAYAALTVEASPDIAPLKDRHMAVVRPEDWEDWLRAARPPEQILRPFPPGSFRIVGPRAGAVGDLFDFWRRCSNPPLCYPRPMCNLYTTKATAAEVAAHFRAQMPTNFNVAEGDVYPGGHGMVVREEAGQRILQSMTWGFPLAMKSKLTGQRIKPKPVNNIADLTSFMWRFVAPKPEHRCIIPLTGFCEAEGEKGAKTRTWFGVEGRPIFAWAGMWKDSSEWGPVYSGLMTDCNEAVRLVHDRMPVLLHEEDHDLWLRGSLDDVMSFQGRCFPDELIRMERTSDPWFRKKVDAPA